MVFHLLHALYSTIRLCSVEQRQLCVFVFMCICDSDTVACHSLYLNILLLFDLVAVDVAYV